MFNAGLCLRSQVEVDGVVVSVAHSSQTGSVVLQLEDGQIRKLLWGQEAPSFLSEPASLWVIVHQRSDVSVQVVLSRQWGAGVTPEAAASASLFPAPTRPCAA